MAQASTKVAHLLKKNQQDILQKWVSYQMSSANWRADLMKESELRRESREFLDVFIDAAQQNGTTPPSVASTLKPTRALPRHVVSR